MSEQYLESRILSKKYSWFDLIFNYRNIKDAERLKLCHYCYKILNGAYTINDIPEEYRESAKEIVDDLSPRWNKQRRV